MTTPSRPWATYLLTLLSLGASALGFLSQIVLARSFGTSTAVNVYFFALGWPLFVGGLLSTAINISLTPALRERRRTDSTSHPLLDTARSARRFSIGVVLAGFLAIPLQLASLPADSALRADPSLYTLLVAGWIFAGLLVSQAIASASLAALNRQVDAALLPLAPPLVALIALFAFAQSLGLVAMLGGQILGAALSVAFVRHALPSDASRDAVRIRMRDMLSGITHGTLAVACFTAYPFADSILAPRLGSGALAQIAYAQRLVTGLGTLTVAAPFALLATRFSDAAAQGQSEYFQRLVVRAILVSLIPSLLMALAFVFGGNFIVENLFGRGRFSPDDVQQVGAAIGSMAPGMVLMLMTTLLFRAGFALQGCALRLAPVGAIWLVTYMVAASLMRSSGVQGLAKAYSLSWLVTSMTTLGIVYMSSRALAIQTGSTK